MARVRFLALALHIFILIDGSSSIDTPYHKDGCSASPLLPERPFVVVWNHPTSRCEDRGIHLDFDRWGILDNTRDRFFGQEIVLFYNLGKWPYYDSKNQPVNGGLPQLSDLQAHLTKVDADLKTSVWNNTFGGLGVIDMEHWRPLYWTNYDSHSIYQRQSQALAKQRFPSYNKTQILAEAIKEFNKAARNFMNQTLQKVTTRRPDGKWGFYLFPQCFDATCDTSTIRNNDRISWLFQESSALYPSIYFKLSTPKSSAANRIKQTLHEAYRVKAKYSSQNIPVLPYSKSQEGPYKMYQKMDLSLAVLQPANMGSSGVVIWGSSRNVGAKNECLILQEYIDNVLGPYVRNVSEYFGNCSQQLCNSHGRCVRKDYERIYQGHLHASGRGECLIPEEILKDKKKKMCKHGSCELKLKSEDASNATKSGQRNSHRKGSKEKSKLSTFMGKIRNYFSLNFKFRNTYHDPFGIRDKMLMRSSKSIINFSIKSVEDNGYDHNVPYQTVREPESAPSSNENPTVNSYDLFSDVTATFNADAPFYDFDDYVCKCYQGFSGDRCDNKI